MPRMLRFTNYSGWAARNEPTAVPAGAVRKVNPVAETLPIYKEGARTEIRLGKDEFYYATESHDEIVKRLEDDGKGSKVKMVENT